MTGNTGAAAILDILEALHEQARVLEDDVRDLAAAEERDRGDRSSGAHWMSEAERIKRELERLTSPLGPGIPANGGTARPAPSHVDRSGALKRVLLFALEELA